MAKFCPLFSGSSGNCYYIGSAKEGVLIDAGRSAKQIVQMLGACQIDMQAVRAVFVTHEHSDHVKGLRVLASRYSLPVYGSAGTLNALEKAGSLPPAVKAQVVPAQGVECAGMQVRPFPTSHDCAEGFGYRVHTTDGRCAAFCTDLGVMTPVVRQAVHGADLVVMESNHDVGMLQTGAYPYPLKRRILSERGHLSNLACADELYELAGGGSTRFVLAHLSEENNTPELAYQTSLCSLSLAGLKAGVDFELSVAPRENKKGASVFF